MRKATRGRPYERMVGGLLDAEAASDGERTGDRRDVKSPPGIGDGTGHAGHPGTALRRQRADRRPDRRGRERVRGGGLDLDGDGGADRREDMEGAVQELARTYRAELDARTERT